jgi:hypothetical protein
LAGEDDMSFYFGGDGTILGVVDKIKKQHISDEAGKKLRDVVVEFLENEIGQHAKGSSLNGVSVSCSGHVDRGGYGSSSVTLSISEKEISFDPSSEEVSDGGNSAS